MSRLLEPFHHLHLNAWLSVRHACELGISRVGALRLWLTDEEVARLRDDDLSEAAAPYLAWDTSSSQTEQDSLVISSPDFEGARVRLSDRRDRIRELRALLVRATAPSWDTAQRILEEHGQHLAGLRLEHPPTDLAGDPTDGPDATCVLAFVQWLSCVRDAAFHCRPSLAHPPVGPSWLRRVVLAAGGTSVWLPEDRLRAIEEASREVEQLEREARVRSEETAREVRDAEVRRRRLIEEEAAAHVRKLDALLDRLGTDSQIERHRAGLLPGWEYDEIEARDTFEGLDGLEWRLLSGPIGLAFDLVGGRRDLSIGRIGEARVGEPGEPAEVRVDGSVDGETWEVFAGLRSRVEGSAGKFRIDGYRVVSGPRGVARVAVVAATSCLGVDLPREYIRADPATTGDGEEEISLVVGRLVHTLSGVEISPGATVRYLHSSASPGPMRTVGQRRFVSIRASDGSLDLVVRADLDGAMLCFGRDGEDGQDGAPAAREGGVLAPSRAEMSRWDVARSAVALVCEMRNTLIPARHHASTPGLAPELAIVREAISRSLSQVSSLALATEDSSRLASVALLGVASLLSATIDRLRSELAPQLPRLRKATLEAEVSHQPSLIEVTRGVEDAVEFLRDLAAARISVEESERDPSPQEPSAIHAASRGGGS